ncbi:MAG: hypothetical protein ACRC80_30350 [Waterburya sp.]
MNSKIQIEIQKLKLYLQQYPQQATQLAINYFEYYLILSSEYNSLKTKVTQLQKINTFNDLSFITYRPLVEINLTLEQEFRVKKFQRFLAQHQDESKFWAITYFHNYLILLQHYHSLKVELVAIITQQSRLRINQYFSSKAKIFSNISLRSISLSVLIFLTNANSLNCCYQYSIDNKVLSYLETETKIY